MTVEWRYFQTFFFFLIYLPYSLSQAAARGYAPTKQGWKPGKRIAGTQDPGDLSKEDRVPRMMALAVCPGWRPRPASPDWTEIDKYVQKDKKKHTCIGEIVRDTTVFYTMAWYIIDKTETARTKISMRFWNEGKHQQKWRRVLRGVWGGYRGLLP